MIKSKINLILFILDDNTFKYNILSVDRDKIIFPSIEIEKYIEIDQSIKHLLSLYIKDKDIGKYCNFKLTDISIDEEVGIYYYAFITHNADIINSFKIPLNQYECNLPNIQKIIRSLD
jgi:hypothetical protein